MKWITLNQSGKPLPKWALSVGIDARGDVYLPAFFAGLERDVLEAAEAAGETSTEVGGHPFVRARWLREAFDNLDLMAMIDGIEQRLIRDGTIARGA